MDHLAQSIKMVLASLESKAVLYLLLSPKSAIHRQNKIESKRNQFLFQINIFPTLETTCVFDDKFQAFLLWRCAFPMAELSTLTSIVHWKWLDTQQLHSFVFFNSKIKFFPSKWLKMQTFSHRPLSSRQRFSCIENALHCENRSVLRNFEILISKDWFAPDPYHLNIFTQSTHNRGDRVNT